MVCYLKDLHLPLLLSWFLSWISPLHALYTQTQDTHHTHRHKTHFQVHHEWPGTNEVLIQQFHDPTTLQCRVSQSPSWPSATLVVQGSPQYDGVNKFIFCMSQWQRIGEIVILDLIMDRIIVRTAYWHHYFVSSFHANEPT